MNKKKLLSIAIALLLGASSTFAQKQPVDYVNPLMGTDSKISLYISCHRVALGNELLDATNRKDG